MWKAVNKILRHPAGLLTPENLLHQQLRTTFILKRKNPPKLHSKGSLPRRLRNQHFIYELVEDTSCRKQPEIEVILRAYVEGLGDAGDSVTVKRNYAYTKLLLPGLAVYANPENCEKYKSKEIKETVQRSSATVDRTINCLTTHRLSIVMNKDMPWTLKPWHVRTSFRKSGYTVPENAIELPKTTISGPNVDLEGKEFYITVTINNTEKVNVICCIRHWSTSITDRLPWVSEHWKKELDPLFPEDAPVLHSINASAEKIRETYTK